MSARSSSPVPNFSRSPPVWSLSAATPSAAPPSMIEAFQVASVRVREATCLGMAFNLSA